MASLLICCLSSYLLPSYPLTATMHQHLPRHCCLLPPGPVRLYSTHLGGKNIGVPKKEIQMMWRDALAESLSHSYHHLSSYSQLSVSSACVSTSLTTTQLLLKTLSTLPLWTLNSSQPQDLLPIHHSSRNYKDLWPFLCQHHNDMSRSNYSSKA